MRRLLFFSIALGLGAAAACGPPFPPFPPDLVTIKGQVAAGGVGIPNASVYAFDRTADAGLDASNAPFSILTDGTGHFAFYGFGSTYDLLVSPPGSPNDFTLVRGLTRRDPVVSLPLPKDADLDASNAPFSVLTDGTGHFAFYGFGSTYDLLVSPPGSPNDFTLVRGLTRRDPVVSLPLPKDAPVHAGTLSPTWSPRPPDGSKIAWFLSGPTYPGVQLVGVTQASADPNATLTATWRGGESTTTNLWALVYTPDSVTGAPTSWVGYGTAYTFLLDQRVQAFSITLQSTTTSQATLQFTAPDGYTVGSANLAVDFGYLTTGFTFFQLPSPQGTSSFVLPNAPFIRLVAAATATNGGASSTAFGIGSVSEGQNAALTIDLPSAPSLSSPDDGATVDAASTFSVQSDALQEMTFTPADASAPKIRVVTSETSVSLAEVGLLSGATFPPGAHYTWQARRWRDFPTTDTFEAAGVDLPKASFATSDTRSFTIASP